MYDPSLTIQYLYSWQGGQKAWTYGPQYLLSWSRNIGGAEKKMNKVLEWKNGLYCRYTTDISKFAADDMIMLISCWYINENYIR